MTKEFATPFEKEHNQMELDYDPKAKTCSLLKIKT